MLMKSIEWANIEPMLSGPMATWSGQPLICDDSVTLEKAKDILADSLIEL
jgi:hypothetical protein